MDNKPLVALSACAAMLLALSASGAFAGEVTGPPGSSNSKATGAPANANSNCAYSGLNDFDPEEGQNASRVQTPADAWKFYGLAPGFPGWGDACKGGTNESRTRTTGSPAR